MAQVKELCRACLCETRRHFYLRTDDELRTYEMVSGVELPVDLFSMHLCFRCYKLYDRIISFRQCCYLAEKYLKKFVKSTDEVDESCEERKKITRILQRDLQYELTQSTTLCLDSNYRGFAEQDSNVATESGNWKHLPCGYYSDIFFHQRNYDGICDELNDDSDYFYDSDDLAPIGCTESEESDQSEEPAVDNVEIVEENGEIVEENGKFFGENGEIVEENGENTEKKQHEKEKEKGEKEAVKEKPGRGRPRGLMRPSETYEEFRKRLAREADQRRRARKRQAELARLSEETLRRLADQRQKALALNELGSKWLTQDVLSVQQALDEMAAYRLSDEFVNAPYKCELCAKIFTYELHMSEHLPRHDESSGDHVCEMCQQRWHDKNSMIHHRRQHLRKYNCNVCAKLFKTRSSAIEHILRIHTGECPNLKQDEKVPCEVCGKMFKNEKQLKIHQIIHDDARNFKCMYCPNIYSHKPLLEQHVIAQHSGTRPFVCSKCGATYATRSSLLWHMAKHDIERSIYRCCGRIFPQRNKYNQHLKLGSKHVRPEDKKFVCTWCGNRYLREPILDIHVARVHLKNPIRNFVCHECGAAFTRKGSLERHLLNHADASPCNCPICPQTFLNHGQLRVHLTTYHTHEELLCRDIELKGYEDEYCVPAKCDQCDKQFKNKHGLKIHHKRVRCPECCHCFPAIRDLELHRQLYHPTELPAENSNNDFTSIINDPESFINEVII